MLTSFIAFTCLITALINTLIGGVLLSFSDFIMRGLAATSPAAGMQAMQSINRTVLRSVFLTAFFVLMPVTVGLAAYAHHALDGWPRILIISAAIIYSMSVFCLTVLGNVPMNKHLESLTAEDDDNAKYWSFYARRWTHLNHVRTAGCLMTAATLLLAAISLS